MEKKVYSKEDNIGLSLPINSAYVPTARLTAASIANRMGFNADEIEDIRAAVSEACIFIIKNASSYEKEFFKVSFLIFKSTLHISLSCEQTFPIDEINGKIGLSMIPVLMDEIKLITEKPRNFIINMKKSHRRSI